MAGLASELRNRRLLEVWEVESTSAVGKNRVEKYTVKEGKKVHEIGIR